MDTRDKSWEFPGVCAREIYMREQRIPVNSREICGSTTETAANSSQIHEGLLLANATRSLPENLWAEFTLFICRVFFCSVLPFLIAIWNTFL